MVTGAQQGRKSIVKKQCVQSRTATKGHVMFGDCGNAAHTEEIGGRRRGWIGRP